MELVVLLAALLQDGPGTGPASDISSPDIREDQDLPKSIADTPRKRKKTQQGQDEPGPERPRPTEPFDKKRKKQDLAFDVRVGLDFEYNDNIIRLDKRDLDALRDGTKPDKFRITQPDDLIYSPWVEGDTGFALFGEHARAGLRFTEHIYQVNSFITYSELNAFIKEKMWEFDFGYIPHVYRREYKNLDTNQFESAFYSDYDAQFAMKFRVWDVVVLRPKVGIEGRDYDAPFNHRDSIFYSASPRATWEITPWIDVFAEYQLVYNESFATSVQPDASYLENGVEFGVGVKPAKGVETSLRYYVGRREYTTNNDPFIDPNHADRVDNRRDLRLKAHWKITKDLTFEGEYRYTDVQTNKPFRADISDEEWSWTRNIVIVGLAYRF